MTAVWREGLSPGQWLLIIALAGAAALTYWLPHRGLAPSAPHVQPPAHADYYARDALMTVTGNDGSALYRIRAREALHYPDKWTVLHTVHLTYFGNRGNPWHLTADQARMPPDRQQIRLSGHVVARGKLENGAPMTLTTPHMTVFPNNKRMQTDARVHVTSGGRRIDAVGMRGNLNAHEVEFLSDVHSIYTP